MNTWSNLNLQDANSYISEQMIFFHDLVMIIITLIMSMIFYLMICLMKNSLTNRFLLQGHLIEIIWTIIPMMLLLFLSIPSLKILYLMDEIYKPMMTIKIIGHQWYWSYEYNDLKKIEFNSFMIKEMNSNNFRLLDVDNRLILPNNLSIRLLITSIDVIHSWAIPSLSLKLDAIPGRINQLYLNLIRTGLFFGQCSEICGANHSFMPIVLESINSNQFFNWMNNF